jgi:phosphoglycolate phosphatase-like HAD superfamily hydrolase
MDVKTPALVLFDIDGTLLMTGGAGVRAMKAVGVRLFGETFTFEGVTFGGGLDPVLFAEAAAQSQLTDHHLHHDRFRAHYIEELRDVLGQAGVVTVMPGIPQVLTTLYERATSSGDVALGLLTGNYSEAVPLKLEAAGIDRRWFSITAFGDEAASRPDLAGLALQRYAANHGRRIEPWRVVVVGDTPRDVQCAKAHGCMALAVATGPYTVAQLQQTDADAVVADLSDPQPLYDLLG